MRIETGRFYLWNRVNQIYKSENQPVNQVSKNGIEENNKLVLRVAHQREAQPPAEKETYTKDGERVSYVPPGEVFEAQG
ncbi:MAG: hypothetical protein H5T91_01560 [Synergistetes bacterium]|nr:MAG: hypothetical protein XD52_0875 [bacterium 42_11]MBC7331105.1 hypothetical protein [Synergistota bacterium]MDK2871014.1 hypothetical protein [bacterium]